MTISSTPRWFVASTKLPEVGTYSLSCTSISVIRPRTVWIRKRTKLRMVLFQQFFQSRMLRVHTSIFLRQHGCDTAHDFVGFILKHLAARFPLRGCQYKGFPGSDNDMRAAEMFQILQD